MPTTPDLDDYRRQAQEWLAANLERRDATQPVRLRGVKHRAPEDFLPERALQKKVYEAGYAGIAWPREYGGQGLTADHARVFAEEARPYRLPDLGVAGGTTYGPCGQTIIRHASPEFLARHVPRMLAGDELIVQFFSEPGAGSDLAGVTTRAVRDGEHWVITGSKIWTSGAYYADYGMCLARTDPGAPKHRGLTWFLVPISSPGVIVQPIKEINGDAEFCQEFLDEVEVSDQDVIGEVNHGWSVAQTVLLFERGAGRDDPLHQPLVNSGIDPHLVAVANKAGRRHDPVARQLLAQAHLTDWVRVQLGHRIAALLRTSDKPASGIAAYWKLAAGTYEPLRARAALELGRGAPLAWRQEDEEGRWAALTYLNSRVWSIAGGSNEMQRNAISERVLGLPREPSVDSDRPFAEVLQSAKNWGIKPD
jgi:alkylation response protein AidB-like acyl-CoA dehydrogenase